MLLVICNNDKHLQLHKQCVFILNATEKPAVESSFSLTCAINEITQKRHFSITIKVHCKGISKFKKVKLFHEVCITVTNEKMKGLPDAPLCFFYSLYLC